jgi:hypothetical protein
MNFKAVHLLELEHVLGFHFLPDDSQKSKEIKSEFQYCPKFYKKTLLTTFSIESASLH